MNHVLLNLLGCQILKDLLVEVHMLRTILLIFGYAAEQLVVGVYRGTFVADVEQAHGLSPDKVEANVLVELLVTAAAAFLLKWTHISIA